MLQNSFVSFQSICVEYVQNDSGHDSTILKYHDACEFSLQVRGEQYLFLNDTWYRMRAGDFCLIRPYTVHNTRGNGKNPSEGYLLNFPEDKLGLLLTPSEYNQLFRSLPTGVFHLKEKAFEQVLALLNWLNENQKKDYFLSEKLRYSHVLQILLQAKECMEEGSAVTPPEIPDVIRPEIALAVNYINMNYSEPLTLDIVAEQAHMSKYYFCRKFREATRMTFLEYLNSVRIRKAQQMLLGTKLSLAEIAVRTGFQNTIHFSRVFRSVYRTSPSEFRRNHR